MDTVTGNPDGSPRFRLSHQGVAVAVRLAMEPDDPAVVHDTVDDRGGHVAVSEHLSPPPEPASWLVTNAITDQRIEELYKRAWEHSPQGAYETFAIPNRWGTGIDRNEFHTSA